MSLQQSRYSAEETARRGDELYEREIRRQVETAHYGKVVAIDIDSGSYVVDDNALAASERLFTQHPNAEIWCIRIGHRALYHMGGRPIKKSYRDSALSCQIL